MGSFSPPATTFSRSCLLLHTQPQITTSRRSRGPRAPCAWRGEGKVRRGPGGTPLTTTSLRESPPAFRRAASASPAFRTSVQSTHQGPSPQLALRASREPCVQRTRHAQRPTCSDANFQSSRGTSAPEPIGSTTCRSRYPAKSLAPLQKEPLPF